MKQHVWKRLMSLALCAVLVFSALGVSALAVDAENYSALPYRCYTYLGDSISWGYGLNDAYDNHDPYSLGARVPGSFPDIVAGVLEQNNGAVIHPAASSGSRLCDFRILLERGMGVENPCDRVDDWYGNHHPERTENLRAAGPEIVSWVREADLVTIQLGINDLAAALANAAFATGLIDLEKLGNISDLQTLADYLQTALRNVAQSPDVLGNLTRKFNSEIAEIRANAAEVLKDVSELAPEADILVVGYHKAVQDFRVIPGTDFSLLFDIIDAALISLNDYYNNLADEYANVYYVDAPDSSVFFPEGTTLTDLLKDTDKILWGVHPDAEGHAYIAQCVLDKLKALAVCHHTHTHTVGYDMKLPFGWEYRSTQVCDDCGRVLNLANMVTPCGDVIAPPVYTIQNAANNVKNAVANTLNRLTGGLLFKLFP